MAEQPEPTGIIVGVDGSPASDAALAWAARDAAMRNVHLTLVHVVAPAVAAGSPVYPVSADYTRWQDEQAQQIIAEARKRAVGAVPQDRSAEITGEVYFAPVLPTLIDLSRYADLMVVGCRGLGALARTLLGSVSSTLIRHAHSPVAVIHADQPATGDGAGPVLVGVDGSPASELATEIAFDEASRRGADLVALHAFSDTGRLGFGKPGMAPVEWATVKDSEDEVLAERLSGWGERYPDVTLHKLLVPDDPARRLIDQARKARLVVVGSHGRGGFTGMLLGSVARDVVNAAQVPVIVARRPG